MVLILKRAKELCRCFLKLHGRARLRGCRCGEIRLEALLDAKCLVALHPLNPPTASWVGFRVGDGLAKGVMATMNFENLVKSPRNPLWLAVHDMTVSELVHAVYGSSPDVVSKIEGVLSTNARELFHRSRAQPKNFNDEATAAARTKFLRHISFYESGILGRPLGQLLYRVQHRGSSLRRRLWSIVDRFGASS